MKKNLLILFVAAAVIALPFILRQPKKVGAWKEGDPVLVVVSPHIASIRDEFERAFSEWHLEKYGEPVRVDWRSIGGTTEIMRYLQAEYASAFKAYWTQSGHEWPENGTERVFDKRFDTRAAPEGTPEEVAAWTRLRDAYVGLRETDDTTKFTCKIDVFFGGGTYDHGNAARQGLTVRIWPEGEEPVGVVRDEDGRETFPEGRGGESWRDGFYYTAALSAFGICYNPDRLKDLGIEKEPTEWTDLADPRLAGQVGVTDPTKSGSIAKAFEMIVHTECWKAVRAAGFDKERVAEYEEKIRAARLPAGEMPEGVPAEYQAAVERGWRNGITLLRHVGANARYYTDGASKVSVDVSMGDAAAGVSIDYYARVQADVMRSPEGVERMRYVTPKGGSSVSGDPISVLRGAPHRELANRFVRFVLSPEGQRLWNYRVGEPGGPEKYALRRMPVLREFYASEEPALQAKAEEHASHTSDPLLDPAVDCYVLSGAFEYVPRWTASHFGFFRTLVKCMCIDSGADLQKAWRAIIAQGGPESCPEAAAALDELPPEVTWSGVSALMARDEMDLCRDLTLYFRAKYAEAERLAVGAR